MSSDTVVLSTFPLYFECPSRSPIRISFQGIHDVVNMALNKIDPNGVKSLHVSFDIDSLDPLEAPSTGTAGKCILLRICASSVKSLYSL